MKLSLFAIFTACALASPADVQPPNSSCNETAVQSLVAGINENLEVQKQELLAIKAIPALQKLTAYSAAVFQAQQRNILLIQQQGIAIREGNQKLAKEIDSPAMDGLNKVEDAQLTEYYQVLSLTGEAYVDAPVIGKLIVEVNGGIEQNAKNAEAAQSACNGAQ